MSRREGCDEPRSIRPVDSRNMKLYLALRPEPSRLTQPTYNILQRVSASSRPSVAFTRAVCLATLCVKKKATYIFTFRSIIKLDYSVGFHIAAQIVLGSS